MTSMQSDTYTIYTGDSGTEGTATTRKGKRPMCGQTQRHGQENDKDFDRHPITIDLSDDGISDDDSDDDNGSDGSDDSEGMGTPQDPNQNRLKVFFLCTSCARMLFLAAEEHYYSRFRHWPSTRPNAATAVLYGTECRRCRDRRNSMIQNNVRGWHESDQDEHDNINIQKKYRSELSTRIIRQSFFFEAAERISGMTVDVATNQDGGWDRYPLHRSRAGECYSFQQSGGGCFSKFCYFRSVNVRLFKRGFAVLGDVGAEELLFPYVEGGFL